MLVKTTTRRGREITFQVDPDVWATLPQSGWFYHGAEGYVYRWHTAAERTSNKMTGDFMHRLVMAAPRGRHVDHANGDVTDNRRCNLRFANKAQNAQNSSRHKDGSSQYKGVYWVRQIKKWAAQIRYDGKTRVLGYFLSEHCAAVAYNEAATARFGEFAKLNDVLLVGLSGDDTE